MFASPDRHNHRAMRGYFETDEERVPVDVYSLWHQTEGSDHKAFVNARALPDARRMDQWAAVVAAAEWEIVDGVGVFLDWREEPVSNDLSVTLYSGDEARSIEVHSFSMQVWGATYMRTSQEITPRLIAEHHYPAGTSR